MCNSETQRKQITEVMPYRWSQASVSDFRLQCSGRFCCLVATGSAGFSSSLGRGIALLPLARAAETLHLMKIGTPHRQLSQMLSWRSCWDTSKGEELGWATWSSVAKKPGVALSRGQWEVSEDSKSIVLKFSEVVYSEGFAAREIHLNPSSTLTRFSSDFGLIA